VPRMETTDSASGFTRQYLRSIVLVLLFVFAAMVLYVSMSSMSPSARVTGPPYIQIDISNLKPGETIIKGFRGYAVVVLHRTQDQIEDISKNHRYRVSPVRKAVIPDPNGLLPNYRSINKEYFVAYTWSGIPNECSTVYRGPSTENYSNNSFKWVGGFYEPCRSAAYDTAGHLLKNTWLHSRDLPIPPYHYLKTSLIEITMPPNPPVEPQKVKLSN